MIKNKELKYLTNNEKKALKELKKEVLSISPEAELILFGSKARGDFDKESDVDVLIIIPDLTKKEKKKIWNLTTNINIKYCTSITPIVIGKFLFYSPKYSSSSFYKNISREGIGI